MNSSLPHFPGLLKAGLLTALQLTLVAPVLAEQDPPTMYEQIDAFSELQRLVENQYYTETDPVDLYNGAIEGYLSQLDPHSTYITPEELRATQERLQGTFEGIGIYFAIHDGYLRVLSPIEGSPAYEVGLQAGDRIVRIDGRSSINIKESEVFTRLKGPTGSRVRVSVQREGEDELLDFEIVRDRIDVPSVPYRFLLSPDAPEVGYVKVNRFSRRTSNELSEALNDLVLQGARKLVLDLRGNGGGYLEQAVEVANQVLEKGRLVVYTMGRHNSSRENHFAGRDPVVSTDIPLIVLVDSYSASASEIVAGAIQDYDRGLIIGHTTFGKGLVQKQYQLKNGGAVLLTVARYFTPSDRPIQRPFDEGREAYLMDAHDNYDPNTDPDSLQAKPAYYTRILRRKVYSSGGITPDFTLPPDSARVMPKGLRRSHFFDFAAENAIVLAGDHDSFEQFFDSYRAGKRELAGFRQFLRRNSVEVDDEEIQSASKWIVEEITRNVAQIRWGSRARGRVDVRFDSQVGRAVDLLDNASELLANRESHYNRGRRTHVPSVDTAEKVR